MALDQNERDIVKHAARVISELADDIKHCHTINGEWDGSEPAAEMEYRQLSNLVTRLHELSA